MRTKIIPPAFPLIPLTPSTLPISPNPSSFNSTLSLMIPCSSELKWGRLWSLMIRMENLQLRHLMLIIALVFNCIWKHPDTPEVYLACDLLGQEEILVNVSRTFGSKVFVDKAANPDLFQTLELVVPDILSEDSSSHFRLFNGFPKLYERAAAKLAEARANSQPEPLIIRASAQWYACGGEECSETGKPKKLKFGEAMRDEFGVWHVCYSMHSSKEELEWALQLLAPKRVVSTTPSCRAMELDYVKKHCFSKAISSDDSLWKLLDINVEASPETEVVDMSPLDDKTAKAQTCEELNVVQPIPSKRPLVTLFGRARFGLHNSNLVDEKRITADESATVQDITVVQSDVTAVRDITELTEKETCSFVSDFTIGSLKESHGLSSNFSVGSSKGYSDGLRRLYTSINVPVPKPLPSLVKLLNTNKRARKVDF